MDYRTPGWKIKMNLVQLGLLCLVITVASCGRWNASSSDGGSSSSVANNAPRQWSPMDFREAYIAAKTESARRDVFLRAIDEGVIAIGKSVAVIDTIASTQFNNERPLSERPKLDSVLFADQIMRPKSPWQPGDHRPRPAWSYVGSYFAFDYDSNGSILKYYFSNLHKGGSRRTDANPGVSNEELKRLYQTAQSREERRNVCLRAIDEGIIQTFGPVNVSTIDAAFGTEFSKESQKRSRKERYYWVYINCDKNVSSGENDAGWYLAIELADQEIFNYYLTNVPKSKFDPRSNRF
jgi:hypothetical protein